MAEKDPQLSLYLGADCHCCGKTQVREHHGATGGTGQPGTPGGLVCPQCDASALPPASWPENKPPASG